MSTVGHVTGYDTEHPGWGQTAEGAWGGQGQTNGQGILTRDFMSGGFTWTGWDYKGEPTPDGWPDINSHFGIVDEAGFPKDRFYWYKVSPRGTEAASHIYLCDRKNSMACFVVMFTVLVSEVRGKRWDRASVTALELEGRGRCRCVDILQRRKR